MACMSPSKKSAVSPEHRLHFRIVVRNALNPDDFDAVFGLQENVTTQSWVVHPGAWKGSDLVFECECRVRPHPKSGAPNFLGLFTQGDAATRFFYLSWRPKDCAGGGPAPCAAFVRRMKIHLRSITWAQIEEARAKKTGLVATVEGRSRDGGPNCASVPLDGGGWRIDIRQE